jgi:transcriptional regulator with XRE-family HTH domain
MNMPERHGAGGVGGARLRALREAKGKTQLWVELEADLGTGYLQSVEYGRVALPVRATLERILSALDATYRERRDVLEQFGYSVATSPPNADEIAWACGFCHRELVEAPFPAYALDCTHRMIAWNRQTPRLFGLLPGDPALGRLAGRSLLEAWFDDASPLARLVVEPEIFLPARVRAFRSEMASFRGEPWCDEVVERLLALPRFRRYWSETEPEPVSAARALVPVRLRVPGAGAEPLQFRLSAEHLVDDIRFRLIYFFPADLPTMQWCAAGAVSEPPAAEIAHEVRV